MSDTKHTPLPWTWQVEEPDSDLYLRTPGAILIGSDGKPENLLAMVVEIDDGAFIVRACNNFDALLGACKKALEHGCSCFATDDPNWHSENCPLPNLRKVIAAAEEKQ